MALVAHTQRHTGKQDIHSHTHNHPHEDEDDAQSVAATCGERLVGIFPRRIVPKYIAYIYIHSRCVLVTVYWCTLLRRACPRAGVPKVFYMLSPLAKQRKAATTEFLTAAVVPTANRPLIFFSFQCCFVELGLFCVDLPWFIYILCWFYL